MFRDIGNWERRERVRRSYRGLGHDKACPSMACRSRFGCAGVRGALVGLLVGIAMVSTAWARPGEGGSEIEKRYGAAEKKEIAIGLGLVSKFYHFKEMNIEVVYLDGKSAVEIFTKAPLETFSDDDVTRILEANSGGKKWVGGDAPDLMHKTWWLDDRSCAAIWDTGLSRVIVCTKEMITKVDSILKEGEAKKSDGL